MTTVVVSSVIANKPNNGGNAWAVLNWVLGFKQLGCQVYLLEQIDRQHCADEAGIVTEFNRSANLAYFKEIADAFGLVGSAALIYEGGEQCYGLDYAELLDLASDADLLINISGHLTVEPLKSRFRRKIYVDFDPGFTQFWHAADIPGAHLDGHDFYYSIGENIGTPACRIPTGGIHWRPIRQPVVLERCSVSTEAIRERFTTVASWRGSYGPIEYGGEFFGLKVHEFRKFMTLPQRAQGTFEIALHIHPADHKDLAQLAQHGWQIVDPIQVAATPAAFDSYLRASGAECSVAQGMYVQTCSGWLSDRTIRYLACGRPALVQDTGFSRNYPVGTGLVPFRTLDEAVEGAASITRDYEAHCQAARALAESYFESTLVLGRLLDEIGPSRMFSTPGGGYIHGAHYRG